jgi:hypothetical protein
MMSMSTGRLPELSAEHEGGSVVVTISKTLGVAEYGLVVGVSGPKVRWFLSA